MCHYLELGWWSLASRSMLLCRHCLLTSKNVQFQSYIRTLRGDYQGLTLPSHQTTTVCCHTTYCDVVLIAWQKTRKFMLCDTGIGDVQKSFIWDFRSIGGDVDKVKISTVFTTQSPAHSHIHSSTAIFRKANTGEINRGGSWRKEWLAWLSKTSQIPIMLLHTPFCYKIIIMHHQSGRCIVSKAWVFRKKATKKLSFKTGWRVQEAIFTQHLDYIWLMM